MISVMCIEIKENGWEIYTQNSSNFLYFVPGMMGWGDNHEIFPEFVRQEFLDTFCRMSAHDDGPNILI